MIDYAALLLIGFSVCAAIVLLAANLGGYGADEQTWLSRVAGVILLVALAVLQLLHADYLLHHTALYESKVYAGLLYFADAAFFLFFHGVLNAASTDHPLRVLHFSPVLLVPWLPNVVAIPLAFVFGTVYSLRLLRLVYRLRSQRRNFRVEGVAFALFAVIAAAILVLGLSAPLFGVHAFFVGYSTLIGLAFAVIVYALVRYPDLVAKAAEAVRSAYANSTLDKVDREHALARLDRLLTQDKVYTDETLSLGSLAQSLELTPHQLSELINTTFGVGFSRHIREHRVEAAKRLLLAEPTASVLSIGLSVGFTSQSNFYAAFREIAGDVPGRFRKRT